MNHDINMELTMEKLLEEDSEFIESLCVQLEEEGINLTNDLLVTILSKYEDQKFNFLKDFLEQVIGQGALPLQEDGGPAIIQVVMDGNRTKEENENDIFSDIDSKYLS